MPVNIKYKYAHYSHLTSTIILVSQTGLKLTQD